MDIEKEDMRYFDYGTGKGCFPAACKNTLIFCGLQTIGAPVNTPRPAIGAVPRLVDKARPVGYLKVAINHRKNYQEYPKW